MPYGLTETGFVPKPYEVIRQELVDLLTAAFGTVIGAAAAREDTRIGKLVSILAERFSTLWELSEAVNSSQDPDAATGAALDALCALTGTVREAATNSLVALILTGTAATLVPSGSRASVTAADDEFETLADATLAAATAWAGTTVYAVGDIRSNATRIYRCITAGTSAGSGGPTTTAADITDNTVHWRYIGEGAAYVSADSQAVETGPVLGVAFSITTIETPVSGWSSVNNILDADVGSDVEADEDLRVRREVELNAAGSSPINALRAALLEVSSVTSVTLFVNNTDATDADGVPPHAVEALVRGGTNQNIFDALLLNVAAGIQTHGNTAGTSEDSEGTEYDVEFSRPDEIEIYVEIDTLVTDSNFPADGEDQIKAAIIAWGDEFATGTDVRSNQVMAQIFTIPGVVDMSFVYIGIAPSPASEATITIAARELAVFDTSRVTFA